MAQQVLKFEGGVEFVSVIIDNITLRSTDCHSECSPPSGSGLPGGRLSSLCTALDTKLLNHNKCNRPCPFASALAVNNRFCFVVSVGLRHTTLFLEDLVIIKWLHRENDTSNTQYICLLSTFY